MIRRILEEKIKNRFFKDKVIIIIGARQVGKTTLARKILEDNDFLFLNGDEFIIRTLLSHSNKKELESIIGTQKIVFIDEAQRIDNIGITAKIIHDQFRDVQLIMSGSSAFELKNQTFEPLTGRKWQYYLYPISYQELEESTNFTEALKDLKTRLIYGFYPDVLNHRGEEREILNEIAESYLFKDILAYGNIRKPEMLEKIVRALAFQVGTEVSYNEIAQLVGIDKNTVAHYIHLLKLAYVVYPLPSFRRNLRNEIKKNRKIYFYDNGIRNALIQNFNPTELRNDIGALWENFLISERLKRNHYFKQYTNSYFWRTKQQQEIDYVEEKDGKIYGYEFKWNTSAKAKIPSLFAKTYDANVTVINRKNFREFIIQ
jgi:predicted AAA+ superfamily ATPase